MWVETARNLGLERAAIAPVSETERAGWQGAIRGLRRPERPRERIGGYGNPGRFTTCRNGFIPTTEDERARFAPYRD